MIEKKYMQCSLLKVFLPAILLCISVVGGVQAGETLVAVAANFTAPAKEIAAVFESKTKHKAILSFGSTGKLYAQIANGAPFDLLLSADSVTPTKAIREGLAVPGSDFTYAKGKIALYSLDPTLIDREGSILSSPKRFNKIAIANPKTAPYGKASVQVMQHFGAYGDIKNKIVKGENVAQVYQFIITANAQLGFIAVSQLRGSADGSSWVPPESLYSPIRQNAALLLKGRSNQTAGIFLEFLKSADARHIIKDYGYGLD